jgi:hypothetical protein
MDAFRLPRPLMHLHLMAQGQHFKVQTAARAACCSRTHRTL